MLFFQLLNVVIQLLKEGVARIFVAPSHDIVKVMEEVKVAYFPLLAYSFKALGPDIFVPVIQMLKFFH